MEKDRNEWWWWGWGGGKNLTPGYYVLYYSFPFNFQWTSSGELWAIQSGSNSGSGRSEMMIGDTSNTIMEGGLLEQADSKYPYYFMNDPSNDIISLSSYKRLTKIMYVDASYNVNIYDSSGIHPYIGQEETVLYEKYASAINVMFKNEETPLDCFITGKSSSSWYKNNHDLFDSSACFSYPEALSHSGNFPMDFLIRNINGADPNTLPIPSVFSDSSNAFKDIPSNMYPIPTLICTTLPKISKFLYLCGAASGYVGVIDPSFTIQLDDSDKLIVNYDGHTHHLQHYDGIFRDTSSCNWLLPWKLTESFDTNGKLKICYNLLTNLDASFATPFSTESILGGIITPENVMTVKGTNDVSTNPMNIQGPGSFLIQGLSGEDNSLRINKIIIFDIDATGEILTIFDGSRLPFSLTKDSLSNYTDGSASLTLLTTGSQHPSYIYTYKESTDASNALYNYAATGKSANPWWKSTIDDSDKSDNFYTGHSPGDRETDLSGIIYKSYDASGNYSAMFPECYIKRQTEPIDASLNSITYFLDPSGYWRTGTEDLSFNLAPIAVWTDISGIPGTYADGKFTIAPGPIVVVDDCDLDISGHRWNWDSSYNKYDLSGNLNVWMKIGYMTRSGISSAPSDPPLYTMYTDGTAKDKVFAYIFHSQVINHLPEPPPEASPEASSAPPGSFPIHWKSASSASLRTLPALVSGAPGASNPAYWPGISSLTSSSYTNEWGNLEASGNRVGYINP